MRILLGVVIAALAFSAPGEASQWVPIGQPVGCHTIPRGYRCSSSTQIHFAYPKEWKILHPQEFFSLFSPLIWVSTDEFEEPCSYTSDGRGGLHVACGWPVKSLNPNGVFIQWGTGVRHGWSLSRVAGQRTRIGHRAAKIVLDDPDVLRGCKAIGADASMTAWVVRRPGSFYSMTACMRGPDVTTVERQLFTVVRTTEFPYG